MKAFLHLLSFYVLCSISLSAHAGELKIIIPKTFSKLMKTAIEHKDAPATCWYLGTSQGYLRAMRDAGNSKAAKLLTEIKDAEGKCGGKNTLDLKATFTSEEWTRLLSLQNKIESADL